MLNAMTAGSGRDGQGGSYGTVPVAAPVVPVATAAGQVAILTPEPAAAPTVTLTPEPTLGIAVPSHSWFTKNVLEYAAWLAPKATAISVGEIDIKGVPGGDSLVVCADVTYTSGGVRRHGVLSPAFWGPYGTWSYENSGTGPAWNNLFYASLDDCLQRGIWDPVFVRVLP